MDSQQDRPKFKKVKRPIRRPADNSFVPEKAFADDVFEQDEANDVKTFDIDSYLGNATPFNNQQPLSSQVEDEEIEEDNYIEPQGIKERFIVGDLYTRMTVIAVAVAALVFGILFAKIFLTPPAIVQNGLQGIVINPEVPRGKARCGVAEKTQGCVLYVMNPQRQELNGRDFYDLAAQLSGRQRFMIETGNMRYASVKIRPGEIAQINIPPLQ